MSESSEELLHEGLFLGGRGPRRRHRFIVHERNGVSVGRPKEEHYPRYDHFRGRNDTDEEKSVGQATRFLRATEGKA